jgi:Asp-tRNA(Asn)/Glu-tRNA(Gln) amidotransferase B subunit
MMFSKEQKALLVLFCREKMLSSLTAKPEEFTRWSQTVSSLFINDVLPFIEEMSGDPAIFFPLMTDDLRDVYFLRFAGFITTAQARQMIRDSWLLGDSHQALFALHLDNEISQDDLLDIVLKVIEGNVKSVEDYRKGKTAAINGLLGQSLRKTKEIGKNADPNTVKEIIMRTLG